MNKIKISSKTQTLNLVLLPVNTLIAPGAVFGLETSRLYLDALIKSGLKITLNNNEYEPLINNQGMCLFSDLPDTLQYTFNIQSDLFVPYYDPETGSVKDEIIISRADIDNSLSQVPLVIPTYNYLLTPSYKYIFPEELTVIKGKAADNAGNVLESAVVHGSFTLDEENIDLFTITGKNGGFALYFNKISFTDIDVNLQITYDALVHSQAVHVTYGKQINLKIINLE